jgi:hypothetical protein
MSQINLKFNLSSRCPTPSPKYALAATALLCTVKVDMDALKNWAILDSGDTSHFLTSMAPGTNITPTNKPIVAQLPSGERMTSMHTCTLDIPALPAAARLAHVIPNLASLSLILVVTFCNAGCTLCNAGCMLFSPKLDAPYRIMVASCCASTNAPAQDFG